MLYFPNMSVFVSCMEVSQNAPHTWKSLRFPQPFLGCLYVLSAGHGAFLTCDLGGWRQVMVNASKKWLKHKLYVLSLNTAKTNGMMSLWELNTMHCDAAKFSLSGPSNKQAVSEKKLFTHINTIKWNSPQLPAQWGSPVKPRDMWHSLWPVFVPSSWAEAQHQHITVPPQVFCFHTVLGVHTTMFPQPQSLLASVFIARCWHKLPVRSRYTLTAVSGTVLLSVADPQPTPQLITLRSCSHCHVSHSSPC